MPALYTSARPIAFAAVLLGSLPALAQVSGHQWEHIYPLQGSPSLTVETADSSLEIHPCSDCHAIRITVQSKRGLNEYRLEESQNGSHVSFSLKEKPHIGHWNWNTEGAKVVVETPAHLDLDAKTADGNLAVHGLEGLFDVRSADGSVLLEDVHGTLRLNTADGNLTVRRASGTLEARGADGHQQIDGQFSAVQMHTSDGSLSLTLAEGSKLSAASRIESSDGHVDLRVPSTLAANLDVSVGDGHVDCSLPLAMEHYDSRESGGHRLHGKLNGGGPPLSVHTSDGSVRIAAL